MTEVGAIAAAIAAVIGLWLWYAKRRKSPTKEERQDDLDRELAEIERELLEARRRGDHARADVLRDRLRVATVAALNLRFGSNGQPGGDQSAGGNGAGAAGQGDDGRG